MKPEELNLLEKYPYLDLTPEDLQLVFDNDASLQRHRQAIAEFEVKIADYERRESEHLAALEKLLDEANALRARLRANDTEMREVRGSIQQMKFHTHLAQRRIKERMHQLEKRQRAVFHSEVKRRLSQMGRELRINVSAARQQPKEDIPL